MGALKNILGWIIKFAPIIWKFGQPVVEFIYKSIKRKKMSERLGVLTPGQQKFADVELIILKGVAEAVDGWAIRLADDIGVEKAKQAILKKYPDFDMSMVYDITDALFIGLGYDPEKYEKEGEE